MDASTSARAEPSAEEDFARIARPLPEPHLLVRADGGVTAWNPAAEEAFHLGNRNPGEVQLAQLFADEPRKISKYLDLCARSGQFLPGAFRLPGENGHPPIVRCDGARIAGPHARILLRFRPHQDATTRFLQLNARIGDLNREIGRRAQAEARLREQAAELEAITTELEETVEALGIQRDEAERARAEAEQASNVKSEFLAVMSHELRTPLNVILGFVDLLEAGVKGDLNEEQREQTHRIRRSARHLITLIEEILAFSRLHAGSETVHVEDVDPAVLANGVADLVEPLIEQRGLTLRRELDDAPESLRTDASKAAQILLNLLGNAAKFTDRGRVTLRVAKDGEDTVFEVIDTGVGIAAEHIDRIFEPFTQLDGSRTRRAGGAGLGLPVSRSLVRLLGGTLDVESRIGVGSTFRLRLPAAGPSPQ